MEACEPNGDTATTQAILQSAEMTPFDIERPDTCFTYDQKGFKYEIPLYCVFRPSNLLAAPAASKPSATSAVPQQQQPLVVAPAPAKPSPSLIASSDDQKAPDLAGGKPLAFKVRFSNGLADLAIDQKTSFTIGQLKQLIGKKYPDLTPDRIRVFYLGKYMSQDRWNMGEIGMKKEMVRRPTGGRPPAPSRHQ